MANQLSVKLHWRDIYNPRNRRSTINQCFTDRERVLLRNIKHCRQKQKGDIWRLRTLQHFVGHCVRAAELQALAFQIRIIAVRTPKATAALGLNVVCSVQLVVAGIDKTSIG